MSLSDLSGIVTTIAEANDVETAFSAVSDAANTLIGHRLFTVMAFDASAMQVERLYSSKPNAYPVGNIKGKRDTAWSRRVLEQGRPYIGENADDIRANFDDHEVILGLRLESVLNVPVRLLGETIGTMNLLHRASYYSQEHLDCALFLAGQLVGPLCKVDRQRSSRTEREPRPAP